MGGSIFTGLGDLYKQSNDQPQNTKQTDKAFPAHVLEVCMDDKSPLYKSPRDIGKIAFRNIYKDYAKEESELVTTAYPLDRSIARYPLAGEEVIVFTAFGDRGGTEASGATGNIYFYSFVVSAMHNVTSNTNPYYGAIAKNMGDEGKSEEETKTRFDKKQKDLDLIKNSSGDLKVYKQLQPFEGDFILQGRFGNTIRFGSTSPKIQTPWAAGGSAPGTSGDGIIVLRVDRDFTTNESDMMTKEDVNADDSAIYLCTTQKIELNLGCSKDLKSWKARYSLADASKSGASSNIAKSKDTSTLWQKPIDTAQKSDQQYNSPVQ
jgi:hypothetical protein